MGQHHFHSLALSAVLLAALATPAFAADEAVTAPVQATHLVGIQSLKSREKAKLTVSGGALHYAGKTSNGDIKASLIEDIYAGTETTQGGGNYGQAAKVGAIAAPYGTGAAITLILRTKVDLLTILYRGPDGDLHSVLLAVSKGKAEPLRTALIAAGARSTPEEKK
jgi:hypothetical protein